MSALGFAINNRTLFGLCSRSVSLVDDADRRGSRSRRSFARRLSRRDAALRTMEEVGGALVSIAAGVVRGVVRAPTAFLGAISGCSSAIRSHDCGIATAIS